MKHPVFALVVGLLVSSSGCCWSVVSGAAHPSSVPTDTQLFLRHLRSTAARRGQTSGSRSGGEAQPARAIVPPFQLQFSMATTTTTTTTDALILTEEQRNRIVDDMETVVFDFIAARIAAAAAASPTSPQLVYVKFNGLRQESNNKQQQQQQQQASSSSTTTLFVDTGVASFASQPTPNATALNYWVKQALQTKLLPLLLQTDGSESETASQTNNSLASLESIAFEWQDDDTNAAAAPTATPPVQNAPAPGTSGAAPAPPPATTSTTVDDNRSSEQEGGGSRNIPLIAGTTAAACFIVLLALAAAKIRSNNNTVAKSSNSIREVKNGVDDFLPTKQQQQSPFSDTTGSDCSSPDTKTSQNSSSNSNSPMSTTLPKAKAAADAAKALLLDDGRSVADSESEWTVATEAGDSMALKSVFAASSSAGSLLKMGPTTSSNQQPQDPLGLALSESFERDRQVAITKDMLTGQWSGRINSRGANGAQSESVLQPSHFSASQERRVRKKAAKAAAAACPDRETSSISSREGETSSNDSLMFDPAHEGLWRKQAEQVSPSRTSRRRTLARSPSPSRGTDEL